MRSQSFDFAGLELEHEIGGESRAVAPDGLIEAAGGHTVEGGQVRVDDDLVAADHEDALGDPRGADGEVAGVGHGPMRWPRSAKKAHCWRFSRQFALDLIAQSR
ncbi:MAG TPA: hypothetical protein VF038_16965 [Usitatibacter sp.]